MTILNDPASSTKRNLDHPFPPFALGLPSVYERAGFDVNPRSRSGSRSSSRAGSVKSGSRSRANTPSGTRRGSRSGSFASSQGNLLPHKNSSATSNSDSPLIFDSPVLPQKWNDSQDSIMEKQLRDAKSNKSTKSREADNASPPASSIHDLSIQDNHPSRNASQTQLHPSGSQHRLDMPSSSSSSSHEEDIHTYPEPLRTIPSNPDEEEEAAAADAAAANATVNATAAAAAAGAQASQEPERHGATSGTSAAAADAVAQAYKDEIRGLPRHAPGENVLASQSVNSLTTVHSAATRASVEDRDASARAIAQPSLRVTSEDNQWEPEAEEEAEEEAHAEHEYHEPDAHEPMLQERHSTAEHDPEPVTKSPGPIASITSNKRSSEEGFQPDHNHEHALPEALSTSPHSANHEAQSRTDAPHIDPPQPYPQELPMRRSDSHGPIPPVSYQQDSPAQQFPPQVPPQQQVPPQGYPPAAGPGYPPYSPQNLAPQGFSPQNYSPQVVNPKGMSANGSSQRRMMSPPQPQQMPPFGGPPMSPMGSAPVSPVGMRQQQPMQRGQPPMQSAGMENQDVFMAARPRYPKQGSKSPTVGQGEFSASSPGLGMPNQGIPGVPVSQPGFSGRGRAPPPPHLMGVKRAPESLNGAPIPMGFGGAPMGPGGPIGAPGAGPVTPMGMGPSPAGPNMGRPYPGGPMYGPPPHGNKPMNPAFMGPPPHQMRGVPGGPKSPNVAMGPGGPRFSPMTYSPNGQPMMGHPPMGHPPMGYPPMGYPPMGYPPNGHPQSPMMYPSPAQMGPPPAGYSQNGMARPPPNPNMPSLNSPAHIDSPLRDQHSKLSRSSDDENSLNDEERAENKTTETTPVGTGHSSPAESTENMKAGVSAANGNALAASTAAGHTHGRDLLGVGDPSVRRNSNTSSIYSTMPGPQGTLSYIAEPRTIAAVESASEAANENGFTGSANMQPKATGNSTEAGHISEPSQDSSMSFDFNQVPLSNTVPSRESTLYSAEEEFPSRLSHVEDHDSNDALNMDGETPTLPQTGFQQTASPDSSKTSRPGRKQCRGCLLPISGKSIRALDGALTGRWHRECFNCTRCCDSLAGTEKIHVLNDQPFCGRCYHIVNNSTCRKCGDGIEGSCLETRLSSDDGQPFLYHTQCLRCAECQIKLQHSYFDVGGSTYCAEHAFSSFPDVNAVNKRYTQFMMI